MVVGVERLLKKGAPPMRLFNANKAAPMAEDEAVAARLSSIASRFRPDTPAVSTIKAAPERSEARENQAAEVPEVPSIQPGDSTELVQASGEWPIAGLE
jgi:hypothetical protein